MGTVGPSAREEEGRRGLAGVPGRLGPLYGQREEAGSTGLFGGLCYRLGTRGCALDLGAEAASLATCTRVPPWPAGSSPQRPCRTSLAQSWCPSRVC